MTRTELPNGRIRLYSKRGITDIRTGKIYKEVICLLKDERYYVEY